MSGSPLNSLIARKIVQYFHHQPARAGTEQPLSTREREVLELLSKGLQYKEIAYILKVNIETVRKHLEGPTAHEFLCATSSSGSLAL